MPFDRLGMSVHNHECERRKNSCRLTPDTCAAFAVLMHNVHCSSQRKHRFAVITLLLNHAADLPHHTHALCCLAGQVTSTGSSGPSFRRTSRHL